jgi:NADH-quinone oxidoreductase subunit J
MDVAFYLAALVAVIATVFVVTRLNAVHALLYLVVSLLAVALIFYVLGAPFAAALEVIVYAGAIMVLFVFVLMMLNLGETGPIEERALLAPGSWIGPAFLALILLVELVYMLLAGRTLPSGLHPIGPRMVGMALYGPYLLAVELGSFLLLAGLIGAYQVARQLPGEMP